jgi:hypothetical protein
MVCQMRGGSVHQNVFCSFHRCALGVAGLSLGWEIGTINPAVGAFVAPIDPPEPMTLKLKNAGETTPMLPTVLS